MKAQPFTAYKVARFSRTRSKDQWGRVIFSKPPCHNLCATNGGFWLCQKRMSFGGFCGCAIARNVPKPAFPRCWGAASFDNQAI